MEGVSFDLDHPPLSVLGKDATPCGTFPASGGIPGRLAGDHVLRGLDVREEVLFGPGGAPWSKGETPHPDDF